MKTPRSRKGCFLLSDFLLGGGACEEEGSKSGAPELSLAVVAGVGRALFGADVGGSERIRIVPLWKLT